MKPDPLLDVLEPEEPVFADSLTRTLRAVRGRRRRRVATRVAFAVAGLLLVSVSLFWRPPGPSVARVPGQPSWEVANQALLARETVSTEAPPRELYVAESDAVVAWIVTDPGERIELLDDDALLSAAPGCIALTYHGRKAEVVWLCSDLLAQP